MSTQSAKGARRSAKTARRTTAKTAKKSAKSSRTTAKTAEKSARRPVAKPTKAAKPAKVSKPAATQAPLGAPELAAAAAMIRTTMSPPVQPAVTEDLPLYAHKYRVGDTVYYTSPSFGRAAASGSYTVVKLLPSDGDDHQYRIKSSGEAFERVAKESQLDRA